MAEIRWTEEAHRRLRGIHDYIAADNPDVEKFPEYLIPLFTEVIF